MSKETEKTENRAAEERSWKARWLEVVQDFFSLLSRGIQGMNQNNVTIMASGLVYSTLVAIVPCITFFVAFLSIFGLLQPFMDTLHSMVEDLFGPALGRQLAEMISQYSSNAMGLGAFGLVSFIITAIFLVDKVYNVLNQIFRTQPSSGKLKRFASFLTFLILSVVFASLLITVNTSLLNFISSSLSNGGSEGPSFIRNVIGSLAVIVITILFLFLLYYFVPNTRIRSRSALTGAVVSGLALIILFNVFKMLVSRMVAYSVIYGSLASLFFVLLFLYVCWYIILMGAEMVYVHQFRPEASQLTGSAEIPSRQIADSINLMMLIGDSYRKGEGEVSSRTLTKKLAITPALLDGYLSLLVQNGLLIQVNTGRQASYVPARPLDQIRVKDIFLAIYGYDEESEVTTAGQAVSEQVMATSSESFSSLTIENLLERI